MWMLRSPVVPADQVTATETRKVANQTVWERALAGLIKARNKFLWEKV
jgi:hypothetical protein